LHLRLTGPFYWLRSVPIERNQHKIMISLAKYFPRFSTTVVAVVRQQKTTRVFKERVSF
jgi:hypothetical protein